MPITRKRFVQSQKQIFFHRFRGQKTYTLKKIVILTNCCEQIMQEANICLGAPQTLIYLQVANITYLPVSIFVFPPNTYIYTYLETRACLPPRKHILTWKHIHVSCKHAFTYMEVHICFCANMHALTQKYMCDSLQIHHCLVT